VIWAGTFRYLPKPQNKKVHKIKIAMSQPTFLPWQGFFGYIHLADKFIFLDDFQYSVQSFHQRNSLFVNKNEKGWYTAVVEKSEGFLQGLNQVKLNETLGWQKKMWERIENVYGKADYFSELGPFVKDWLLTAHESLAVKNQAFIQHVCEGMKWETEFLFSSEIASDKTSSERVLQLLKHTGATCYYAAPGSFDYMQEEKVFPIEGIEILFLQYEQHSYKQKNGKEFMPYLSVLDALFNIGFEASSNLIQSGVKKLTTWQEMPL
jgi:hypothetical protein